MMEVLSGGKRAVLNASLPVFSKDAKYKVFWCSCVPIDDTCSEEYFFSSLRKAKQKFKELTERDLSNERITSNVGFIYKQNDEGEYEELEE